MPFLAATGLLAGLVLAAILVALMPLPLVDMALPLADMPLPLVDIVLVPILLVRPDGEVPILLDLRGITLRAPAARFLIP